MRIIAAAFGLAGMVLAQGTVDDYRRAQSLQATARGLVANLPGPANWIGASDHLWYWKSVKGGTEFVIADASAGTKKPAFDHQRLAAAINAASGGNYTGF